MPSPASLALGFDLSTQQLKVVAIDVRNLETFYEQSLTFETDFPHYKTVKGVYSNEEEHEVYSPVEMWIEALDVILGKMKDDGFPFGRVVSISGAGQVIRQRKSGGGNGSNMLLCSGPKKRRNCKGC
jgi:xylulokinase